MNARTIEHLKILEKLGAHFSILGIYPRFDRLKRIDVQHHIQQSVNARLAQLFGAFGQPCWQFRRHGQEMQTSVHIGSRILLITNRIFHNIAVTHQQHMICQLVAWYDDIIFPRRAIVRGPDRV